MAFKAILVLCAQALLFKNISGIYLNEGCDNFGVYNNNLGLFGNNVGLVNNNLGLGSNNLGLINSNVGIVNSVLPNNGLWAGSVSGLGNIAANNGGGLAVQSLSPIAPTGVNVQSSNALEGALLVEGILPFLSSVTLEGLIGSAGSGDVAYTCGNGNIGIVSENYAPNAIANNGLGLVNAGYGNAGLYNAGYGNAGLINAGYGNAGLINAGYGNAGILNAELGYGGLVNGGLINAGYGNGLINGGLVNAGFSNGGLVNGGLLPNIGGCGCNALY